MRGVIKSVDCVKKQSIIASAEEANEAESRRQHREWKRLKKLEDGKLKQLKKEEDEKLKVEWRKHGKWDVNGGGKPKRIGFKRWKIWKGYEAADDVLSLHSVRQPSPAPSEELYYYDTSRPAASQRFTSVFVKPAMLISIATRFEKCRRYHQVIAWRSYSTTHGVR